MSLNFKKSRIPFCPLIPEDWREIPNKYIFKVHSHKVGNKFGEYQLLSLTKKGVLEKDINASGGKKPASYEGYQSVEKGNMVFCLFDLDCSAVFSGVSQYDGMITSAYDVFEINSELADPKFLDYWFSYVFSNRYYMMFSKNIRYSVSLEIFKDIYTPLPSLEKQKTVVAFLDSQTNTINKLISNAKEQIEQFKKYKDSLVAETVLHGINKNVDLKDTGIEWMKAIPVHWNIVCLSSLFSQRKHKNEGMLNSNLLSLSYGQIIRKDINTREGLLPENFEGYNIIEPQDIVLRLTDLQNDHTSLRVGYCNELGIITSAYVTLTMRNTDYASKFYYYVLHTFDIKKGFYGMGAGVRQNLTFDGLKNLLLPMPPESEQYQIVEYLDSKCKSINELIKMKQEEILQLEKYKLSILFECITGKKEIL